MEEDESGEMEGKTTTTESTRGFTYIALFCLYLMQIAARSVDLPCWRSVNILLKGMPWTRDLTVEILLQKRFPCSSDAIFAKSHSSVS